MGRSRFLPRHVIGLLALALVACGGDDELLVAGDVESIYAGGGSSQYKVATMDPGQRGTISGKVRFEGRAWDPRLIDMASDKFSVDRNRTERRSEDFKVI